jgi:transketolase
MPVSPIKMADAIRVLSMDAVHKAKSGHQGMPMGMADVATVLWGKFLKFDASKPDWADRDRFVLSAGHGSMLLYSLLHLTGFKAVTMKEIENFRQWGSLTPGHPEVHHTPGVETTTGPLGQGLATAVGMAMAEAHLASRFGADIVDHRTWVIAGDGCLMEGVSHEAISIAGRLKLSKLTVLFDDNNTTIDGVATISETGDQVARFKAAGWAVKVVDGHDHGKIAAALRWATKQDRPTMIACKTLISKGAGPKEGDPHSHGYTLFDNEIAASRVAMGWDAAPFTVPDDIAKAWKSVGRRGASVRKPGKPGLAASPKAADFNRAMKGALPANAFEALDAHIAKARDQAGQRHPRSLRRGPGPADPVDSGNDRRLGRPDRLEQHLRQGHEAVRRARLCRPLRPLRRARVRHGRGDERHGPARRRHPLFGHLPGLRRLQPRRRSAWAR